jgi:hypothetical protein
LLTDEELDRVVIHEWAHVQRRDDVAHLLQLVVGVMAGWHPAVWWCHRRMSVEREVACDEMAVGITGSAKAYAACLTRVATVQSASARPLRAAVALSTTGLRHRIVRILSFDRRTARPGTVPAIAAGIVLAVTAVTAGNYRPIAAGPVTTDGIVLTTLAAIDVPSPVRPAPPIDSPEPAPRSGGSTSVTEGPRRTRVRTAPAPVPAPSDHTAPAGASLDLPAHQPQPLPLASRTNAAASAIDVPPGLARPAGVPASSVDASISTAPSTSPWGAAADAGVAVGRGTQDAAVATAGFFNRFGQKIADSF